MGCEYCGAVGRKDHPSACPNAPHWEPPKLFCIECGTELDERADRPFHGLCMECFEGMFVTEAALEFIRSNEDVTTDFFEYADEISYRKHPQRRRINELLLRQFIIELGGLEPEREAARSVLKEYCFASEVVESFADFMYEEGWL